MKCRFKQKLYTCMAVIVIVAIVKYSSINYFCTVLLGKLRVGQMYVVLTLFPGHHSAFLLLARGMTLVQYCTVFSSEIKLRTVCMNFMCT